MTVVSSFSSSGKASGPAHAHVAIVGAGPRGTSVVERLAAYAPDLITPGKQLTVHVIDPSTPGAGNVWRTTQSSELLMNTVTSQITLYTDKSVESAARICPGPTLYEWIREKHPELKYGPDDYPTRALYGEYLTWIFNDVIARAPPNFHVEVHATRAVRLDDGLKGFQTLALENGTTLTGLTAVVLAQGHLSLLPDPEQLQLTAYAAQHRLTYIAPANPADIDLSCLAADEPVFLRGLGLCFFDYMALLTLGRGGRFERTSSEKGAPLRYIASGAEPRMYASSRRGIPFQARGDNEKGAFGRHYSILMTDEVIAGFRRRATAGGADAPDFLREVWPLIRKEVELIYYEALLKRTDFRERFLAVASDSAEESQLLEQELGLTKEQRWCWDRIGRPHAGKNFASAAEWNQWLVEYLREDVRHASLGNVSGPVKGRAGSAARPAQRGPPHRRPRRPRRRVPPPAPRPLVHAPERLPVHRPAARAHRADDRAARSRRPDAGRPPTRSRPRRHRARRRLGRAVARDPRQRRPRDRADRGAPARAGPAQHGRRAAGAAAGDGAVPPHTVDGYETGGLDVTHSPFHLIDCQGRAHPRRFALGVPTEGAHWVTAAGARPGVNSVTLCDTDAVAGAALVTAAGGLRGLSPEFRPMVQSEAMKIQPIRL
ncbi:FAD-NAD(P)-binding-domain-containing protein [Apiospora hydei]|uniref:FAD-NAD(P)-binding-domain-containing protein n=1 Tax=Apiospora hydei TaxID=1337664 RepID=A0ABR1W8B3_9PEZI